MKTERLILKRLGVEDAAAVLRLTSNPEVAKYMRFYTQETMEEARALIEEYTAKGNAAFLYSEADSRQTVGVFALKKDREEEGAFDLSAFSDPAFWNKGYAAELLGFMTAYAKEKLGANKLKAYVVSQNLASRKVLKKHGFTIREQLVFDDLPQGLYVYEQIL